MLLPQYTEPNVCFVNKVQAYYSSSFFITPKQAAHRYNEHKQLKYKTINYNLKSIVESNSTSIHGAAVLPGRATELTGRNAAWSRSGVLGFVMGV